MIINNFDYLIISKTKCEEDNDEAPFKWSGDIVRTNSGVSLEFAMMSVQSCLAKHEAYLVSLGVSTEDNKYSWSHVVCFYRDYDMKFSVENYIDADNVINTQYTADLEESIELHMNDFLPTFIARKIPLWFKEELKEVYRVADGYKIMQVLQKYFDRNVSRSEILKALGLGGKD